MAADIGLPVLDDVNLKKKSDLEKIKNIFDTEKARLKEEEGKGMRRMTIMVSNGNGNHFDEALICSTTKKYIRKLIEQAGPEQVKQTGKIGNLSCLRVDV